MKEKNCFIKMCQIFWFSNNLRFGDIFYIITKLSIKQPDLIYYLYLAKFYLK